MGRQLSVNPDDLQEYMSTGSYTLSELATHLNVSRQCIYTTYKKLLFAGTAWTSGFRDQIPLYTANTVNTSGKPRTVRLSDRKPLAPIKDSGYAGKIKLDGWNNYTGNW
jgi:hypothetical protein